MSARLPRGNRTRPQKWRSKKDLTYESFRDWAFDHYERVGVHLSEQTLALLYDAWCEALRRVHADDDVDWNDPDLDDEDEDLLWDADLGEDDP